MKGLVWARCAAGKRRRRWVGGAIVKKSLTRDVRGPAARFRVSIRPEQGRRRQSACDVIGDPRSATRMLHRVGFFGNLLAFRSKWAEDLWETGRRQIASPVLPFIPAQPRQHLRVHLAGGIRYG